MPCANLPFHQELNTQHATHTHSHTYPQAHTLDLAAQQSFPACPGTGETAPYSCAQEEAFPADGQDKGWDPASCHTGDRGPLVPL